MIRQSNQLLTLISEGWTLRKRRLPCTGWYISRGDQIQSVHGNAAKSLLRQGLIEFRPDPARHFIGTFCLKEKDNALET